jgi:hypothetical protein
MQSSIFGSPPNWHLAYVTWFFQKVLEKHGIGKMYNDCDGSRRVDDINNNGTTPRSLI